MTELKSLLDNGLTLSEIAKIKCVSRQLVNIWAKKEGIDYQQILRDREMAKVKKIAQLANQNLSMFEIAERLPEIPFNTICSLILKHKIKVSVLLSGRKPIGDRAMTKSERNRKRYQQNKEKFKKE